MRKLIIIKILAVILLFFLTPASASFAENAVTIDNNITKIRINEYVEFLEDQKGTIDIRDLIKNEIFYPWFKSSSGNMRFGFTKSVYWLRFKVVNKYWTPVNFFLEEPFSHLDEIHLFFSEGGTLKEIRNGDLYPLSKRPYKSRGFVFPLTLNSGAAAEYFLRIKSSSPIQYSLALWSPDNYREEASADYYVLMLFYGLALVMFLYNIIFMFFIRWIEYLYYSFSIFFFTVFLSSMDGTASHFIWPEHPWLSDMCIPLVISMYSIFGLLLIMTSLEFKQNDSLLYSIGRALIISWAAAFLISLLLNLGSALTFVVLLGTITILFIIIAIGIMAFRKNRTAYILLAGIFFFSINFTIFILLFLGVYSISTFINLSIYITASIALILFAITLADKINIMRKTALKTEEKYRSLVESSNDILFSLDGNLNFISVNSAVWKHLGFEEGDIIGTNFLDLISESWNKKEQISKMLVEAYIEELMSTKGEVQFRCDFKTYNSHEPKELSVKLEYAGSKQGAEKIIGKAYHITDDILLQYLKSEKLVYQVENYLNNAELISQRLTRNLGRFLGVQEIYNIRVAIREMLVNAIEHGNLDIDFDEKTKAMTNGNYMRFIQRRQKNPIYSGKRVHIESTMTEKRVEYRITDEGKGFNHRSFLKSLSADMVNEKMLTHGRGLLLSKQIFDDIIYNNKGNQVILIKNFK